MLSLFPGQMRADAQITGLKVWNTHRGHKTWQAELEVSQLRLLVLKFIDLLESGSSNLEP